MLKKTTRDRTATENMKTNKKWQPLSVSSAHMPSINATPTLLPFLPVPPRCHKILSSSKELDIWGHLISRRRLCGALGGSVIMWAPIRVFSLSLGDGLHWGIVQPAADTVAAAAGHRRDPGASNPCWGWRGKAFGGKPFYIDSWRARWQRGQCFSPRCALVVIIRALCGFWSELTRRFGQDGALQDFSGRHAVTRIWATAFLEEQ